MLDKLCSGAFVMGVCSMLVYQQYVFNKVSVNSVQLLSRVHLFATPWSVARQIPLTMQFPRQEYWSG